MPLKGSPLKKGPIAPVAAPAIVLASQSDLRGEATFLPRGAFKQLISSDQLAASKVKEPRTKRPNRSV